ncbi:Gag-pro-like protein [Gossypium australe]|uniref:Gag-pro-like protein n=1 Tax=Gossypium australe TaxID=47621 RepID=A0A5B6WU96_9ROSI|nr:Gag-pro-like protein [Gossypium australe]
MTTPEYDWWWGKRINDNIPRPSQGDVRPTKEQLHVIPSELEIVKQDFERRSRELGKRIEQLEEEKMQLGLDVDIHKLEAEKLKKGKNKAEEDLDSLKTDYKKLRMSIRTAGLGKTSEQWQQEIEEEKSRANQWEKKFRDAQVREDALKKSLLESQNEKERLRAQIAELEKSLHLHRSRNSIVKLRASQNKIEEMKGRIGELETALQDSKIRVELLEANNKHWKEQLHHSQGQIRDRDYVLGEAVVQVREVADHLQTLAIQADVLSLQYESVSDRGQKLAWLLRKVKDLGIRAKSTRLKARAMDAELNERIERMERIQRELQEQLTKSQQEARDLMVRSREESLEQKDQMAKMMEMMAALVKGKGPMQSPDIKEPHSRVNQDPLYLPRFTPPHAHVTQRGYPQEEPVGLEQRPAPPAHLGQGMFVSNSGDNSANPIVPDLDDPIEIAKLRMKDHDAQDKYNSLEERLKAIEGTGVFSALSAKELSLVPDLMAGYVNEDKLLIHCFQDSLIGSVLRWYNQLSRERIQSWKDLASAFCEQYKHVSNMALDRLTLQMMEKKPTETFRQYAQRMEGPENSKRPVPIKKKEAETHMVGVESHYASNLYLTQSRPRYRPPPNFYFPPQNPYYQAPPSYPIYATNNQRPFTMFPPNTMPAPSQPKNEQRPMGPNPEKPQFTSIPVSYGELCLKLLEKQLISPHYMAPLKPLYPKWYDPNASCMYHAGNQGHSTENCIAFKRRSCEEFRKLLQDMMNNKEIKIFDKTDEAEEGEICASDNQPPAIPYSAGRPLVIYYEAKKKEVKPKMIIKVPAPFPYKDDKAVPWKYDVNITIPEATTESVSEVRHFTRSGRCYSPKVDEPKKKAVDANQKGKAPMRSAEVDVEVQSEQEIKRPVNEDEAHEFLKFIKHSEYNIVEQLNKQPARISVLSLLLSSEPHRNALLKVLNQAYVPCNVRVNNLSAYNFISFSDDEIPPNGRGSVEALHITTGCKGYIIPNVLIDNGSALNVMPLATLSRMPVDMSYLRPCHSTVRAFDGTRREVMGKIEIPLEVGPCTYDIEFQVMDIASSYNCLLGRPWIHSAGVVPSSLHQKVKFVMDNRLITVAGEEDIVASISTDAPYIKVSKDAVECSFRSFEFINAPFVVEGNKIPTPKLSRNTKMGIKLTVGKGARAKKGLGRCQQGIARALKPVHHKADTGLQNFSINGIDKVDDTVEDISMIRPVPPGFVLNNWAAVDLLVVSKSSPKCSEINGMNNPVTSPKIDFKKAICLGECEAEENAKNYVSSPDLLRMVGRR